MADQRQRQSYKASATGHPAMENEGIELRAQYDGAQSESSGAQQNGYDNNVFGFRDGIVNAHGIRRGVNG